MASKLLGWLVGGTFRFSFCSCLFVGAPGEMVAVMTMVHVEVVEEVMDVIEVVADKQVHNDGDKVTR